MSSPPPSRFRSLARWPVAAARRLVVRVFLPNFQHLPQLAADLMVRDADLRRRVEQLETLRGWVDGELSVVRRTFQQVREQLEADDRGRATDGVAAARRLARLEDRIEEVAAAVRGAADRAA